MDLDVSALFPPLILSPYYILKGIKVYNTYDRNHTQLVHMIIESGIEAMIFDIQDVGTRFYTYIWTMWDCMLAAAEASVPSFHVLDRPNPLGGEYIDGPLLRPPFSSFVGRLPIPLVHGLTVGELAKFFYAVYLPPSTMQLNVVEMQGWSRSMSFPDTGLSWVMPSPNMPTFATALVYPGVLTFIGFCV